jgi:hypothetical protein
MQISPRLAQPAMTPRRSMFVCFVRALSGAGTPCGLERDPSNSLAQHPAANMPQDWAAGPVFALLGAIPGLRRMRHVTGYTSIACRQIGYHCFDPRVGHES